MCCTLIQTALQFVGKVPVDSESASVQDMVWYQQRDKPISEPIMTQITEAYMRCQTSYSFL